MNEQEVRKAVHSALTDIARSSEWTLHFGRTDREPDAVVTMGNTMWIIETKAGDPNLPLPSGTSFQIDQYVRRQPQEWMGHVRGIILTNYQVPAVIAGELQLQNVKVLPLNRTGDEDSIKLALREAMRS